MSTVTSPLNAGTIFGGALLVTGTCIGAGMIGLPVKTAAIGFYPTLLLFTVIWLLMASSAFLMLEASFALKGETNLISMAKSALGFPGAAMAWVTYVLFLYTLMAAYTSGGTGLLVEIMPYLTRFLSHRDIMILFVLIFSSIILSGTRWVDYMNRILMLGLIVSYGLLLLLAGQTHRLPIETVAHPQYIWTAIPLIVISFGFHLLIPSLKSYMHENVFRLRWAIGIGSLIPLAIYLLWQFVIMTTLPTWGSGGLVAILNGVGNPAELLINRLSTFDPGIARMVTFFSFFAMVTSFVGVGLGLFDFFADGFKIQKNKIGKLKLILLTFFPPAVFAWLVPNGFLLALGYASIFAAILLIIYPAALVLATRKHKEHAGAHGKYRVNIGTPIIVLIIICGLLVIGLEVSTQMGVLPLPS